MISHKIEMLQILVTLTTLFILIIAVSLYFTIEKLLAYLKKKEFNNWQKLTYSPLFGFGIGVGNTFRIIPYLWNSKDNEDKKILYYKSKSKTLLLTMFLFFVTLIFVIFYLFYQS